MGKKPGSGTATNNKPSYFNMKVELRLRSLPDKSLNVLECFAGEGLIWDAVQKRFPHKINRTKIDINDYPGKGNLKADSLRVIGKIALQKFDVIDLDSWGSPINHLSVLFNRKYKGIVHCTYCQPIPLNPDRKLATAFYNMSRENIKQKPSLFAKMLPEMILNYLKNNGIMEVNGHLSEKQNYFWFKIV